jgi:hypothetical protein
MSRAAARNASGSPSKPKANDSYPLDYFDGTYAMDPDNVQSSEGYDFNALQRLSFCCNEPGAAAGSPPESSIALVGYGGFVSSDVTTFFGNYGMAYDINAFCIGGGSCPGNDGEAPLDVEYSGAMSNSYGSYLDTAHIYEYEMTNNLYTTYESAFNDIVSDGYAKVVSTSYGWQENVGFSGSVATGTMHPIFNTMVGTGITLIAASGDNGASDGCAASTSVDYPSSDPDFIAAGGTQLNMYTDGTYYSETAWQGEFWSGACGNNHGGSTGGVSVLFAAPSWQSSVVSPFYLWKTVSGTTTEYVETGNGNRMVPDISLTANPDVLGQWYYSGGSWQDEGGTSIVAPELAGFFAQENSYLDYIGDACGGSGTAACSPVGLASPWIYYDATGPNAHNPFYDMTSGCDNNDVTVANDLYYFCAYGGYDPITGWGSANMMQLAWGINWELIPAYGSPSLSFGGPATSTWFNTDQIVDWDLSDGGSPTPPGAAGFTLGWDSIPSDPSTEPGGGDGNSFYAGPEYPFSTFGCVDNNGTYCQAASGEGCHTVYVEGWDNQGNTTYGSYGPVCFDDVVPTITVTTNPAAATSTWVDQSVTVTLHPSDPGGSNASGIATTYYASDTGSCYPGSLGSCSIYSGPFSYSAQGANFIYYFTVDNAGNYSAEPYIYLYIDTTKPVTTSALAGSLVSGSTFRSHVKVTLSASTTGGSGVANTYYKVDGGAQTTYTGPFTVTPLGSHSITYWSVSGSGEKEGNKVRNFSIVSPTTAVLVATPNPAVLGGSVTMTATITATLPGTPTGTVTFYNGATNLGTGTLSGGVATFSTTALPAGALTLQASYPATGNFLGSNSAPYNETVNEHTTTALTSSLNPSTYGQSVTFTAHVTPSSSGTPTGSVGFYAGSTLLGTVTLSGSDTATLTTSALGGGANSMSAVYSGDSIYLTSTGTLTQNVNKASQTITFPALPALTYGETGVTLSATASSGLAVSYTSTTPSICTVSGSTLTLVGAQNNCTIQAAQAGNSNYLAAATVTQSSYVNRKAQTINFPVIPSQIYGTDLALSATASSGLPVSFASTTTSICTVSGTTATMVSVGTCTIKASQAGNSDYLAAGSASRSFAVTKAAQTITFAALPSLTYGVSPFTVSATATSGLTVTFTSTTPSICTVSGTTVTVIGGQNDCTIQANQAGNSNYLAAPAVTRSSYVNRKGQSITFPTIPTTHLSAGTVSLSATASSGLTVSFASTTPSVCTVSGTTATLVSAGTCTIQATQAGNSDYLAAATVNKSFTVTAN